VDESTKNEYRSANQTLTDPYRSTATNFPVAPISPVDMLTDRKTYE